MLFVYNYLLILSLQRFSGLPLQECNHIESSVMSKDAVEHSLHESYLQQKENERQKDHQQMLKFRDRLLPEAMEDEHEKRRSSERVSRSLIPPRSVARRNMGRKKRTHQTSTSSAGSEDSVDVSVKVSSRLNAQLCTYLNV